MTATVLITGGRAPVALDLARKFARSGCRVLVAESSRAQLCSRSRAVARSFSLPPPNREPSAFVDALVDIVRREHVDVLVPTCEEIFWVSRGLDRLRPLCTVWAASLDKLRRLHSKWEFVELARTAGLPVPFTQLGISGIPTPYVLKPVFSRFGTEVHVVTDTPPGVDPGRGWVAQEFLTGQQICTYSVAVDGRLVAHAAYATEFTAGPGACVAFEPADCPAVDSWVERFVKSVEFTGQIAFDFIVGESGEALPLECNPRATSGVHLLPDQLSAIFLGDLPLSPLRPTGDRTMIAMAMLSFGLASVRSWRGLRRWAAVFRTSADVIGVKGDRRPFWAQFAVLRQNAVQSLRERRSMIACSTADIEWDGR